MGEGRGEKILLFSVFMLLLLFVATKKQISRQLVRQENSPFLLVS